MCSTGGSLADLADKGEESKSPKVQNPSRVTAPQGLWQSTSDGLGNGLHLLRSPYADPLGMAQGQVGLVTSGTMFYQREKGIKS